jgi:hypothetical protein
VLIIPELRRLRQEDSELEYSLDNRMRPCLNKIRSNGVYPWNGILFDHKKKSSTDTCYNIDEL